MVKDLQTRIDNFLIKARLKHGNKFDYSLMNYVDQNVKIKLVCNNCKSIFEQSPKSHLQSGCPKCANISRSNLHTKTQEQCIKDFKKAHGNKYDYSLVKYKNWKEKVIIICPIHGQFLQEPNIHRMGSNCPKCANHAVNNHGINVPLLQNINIRFYLVKFKSKKYEFFKVGITSRTVEKRFKPTIFKQYEKEVILDIELPNQKAIDLESKILINFDNYRYHILEKGNGFKGCTELFNLKYLDEILLYINQELSSSSTLDESCRNIT